MFIIISLTDHQNLAQYSLQTLSAKIVAEYSVLIVTYYVIPCTSRVIVEWPSKGNEGKKVRGVYLAFLDDLVYRVLLVPLECLQFTSIQLLERYDTEIWVFISIKFIMFYFILSFVPQSHSVFETFVFVQSKPF